MIKYLPKWFKYRFCKKGNHLQGYCFHVDMKRNVFIAYCDHCNFYNESVWKQ